VRRGQPGQLYVRSRSVALRYVGQEDLFERRLRGGEWSMGDIGRVCWDGSIELLDRHIDQVEGVESCISAEDVLLARLPEASEVVVLGDMQGRPRAVVCTHGDRPIDSARWRAAVQGLPELGEPILVPWAKVPRTGTWKVRRPLLREQLFGQKKSEISNGKIDTRSFEHVTLV
jgi:long-chain acyl-CoA synthetase